MKPTLKIACVLLCFPLIFGCERKKIGFETNKQINQETTNQSSEETKKMEYLEKYQIRNEIAFDCPKEVSEQRSDV